MANTEELTLIDAENNTELKIIVSSEDAIRARNDHVFAYSLLQQARKYMNEEKNEEGKIQNNTVQSERDNTYTDAVASCSTANDLAVDTKELHMWSRAETLLLINLYKKHIAMFDNPKISSKHCWNILSKKMEESGYQISSVKCTTKFQCLKRSYKSVIDHNKKSGNNRKEWEYYEIMHEIFGRKPWIKPIATAGSNIDVDDINNNIENVDPKSSVPKKRKRSSAIEDYLDKSLEIKKEREKNTQKRHEEKMTRLSRIEALMNEVLKK